MILAVLGMGLYFYLKYAARQRELVEVSYVGG